MNDSSRQVPSRSSISLVPGVIYEWTPAGVMLAEPEYERAEEPAQPDIPPFKPGSEPVAGYHLAERIGEGCTGEVWRAIGPGGVAVALKFIATKQRGSAQELRSLAVMPAVRHANLVTLCGIWEHADWTAIGMDLADGSLLDRFAAATEAGGPGLGVAELTDYLRQAARGIDFLNQPPVALIHRDIKPQNLLIVGGSVKVGDFGLVAPLTTPPTPVSGASSDGVASLLTAYTAPEVRRGGVARQSDQYSLAATYCHLRGGRAPALPLTTGEPVDLSMLPPRERPAVARALAILPSARWPSCSAFVEALVASVRPQPLGLPFATPAQAIPTGTRWLRPLATASLLAVAAVGAVNLAWSDRATVAPKIAAIAQPEPVPPTEPSPESATTDSNTPVEPMDPSSELVATGSVTPIESTAELPVALVPSPHEAEPIPADQRDEIATPAEPALSGADLAAMVLVWVNAARDRFEARLSTIRLSTMRTWLEAAIKAMPDPAPAPAPAPAPLVGPPAPAPRPTLAREPAGPPVPRTVTIIVRMPNSKAELVVRGEVGRGNPDEWYGPRRVIHSPPLAGACEYLVGAFWTDPGGRPMTRSQPVRVEPGRLYEVDLRAETPTATEVPRPPAS